MSFTVGNPLFIVQQGQSPLHVVLPVVCRAGEFPNNYFHGTMASESTNTTEIWVYAKHYNYSAVNKHNWGLVINICQRLVLTAMPTRLSNCGIWTFKLEIPCFTSLSSVVPVLELSGTQVNAIKTVPFINCGFIYGINNSTVCCGLICYQVELLFRLMEMTFAVVPLCFQIPSNSCPWKYIPWNNWIIRHRLSRTARLS